MARRNLVRLARPSHWHVLPEFGDFFRLEARRDERCPNRTGGDAVHPDALLHQCLGERARKGDDSPTRGAVVDQMAAAAISRDRSGVHNRAALLEMRKRGLGHVEIAVNICLEGLLQLLCRNLSEIFLRMLLGGIVHKHIEVLELLDALRYRLSAKGGCSDIAFYKNGASPFLLDELLRPSCIPLFFEIDDGNIGTLAGE